MKLDYHKTAGIIMSLLIAILLTYTGIALYFSALYQVDGIRYESITVNGEEDVFHRGDRIDIHYDRCSDEQYPAKLEFLLVGEAEGVKTLRQIGFLDVIYEQDCNQFVGTSIVIPKDIPLGDYHLEINITYEVQWIMGLHKTNTLEEKTETFSIIK